MSASHNASSSYSATMSSMSPPPPVDLGSYARLMHQHTKRQMDSISDSSRQSTPQNNNDRTTTGAMPNGVSNHRRNPSDYGYRS